MASQKMPKVRGRPQCEAITTVHKRCKNNAILDGKCCFLHTPIECAICLTDVVIRSSLSKYTLACKHSFHKTCIKEWIGQHSEYFTCPLCRLELTPKHIYALHPMYIDEVVVHQLVFPICVIAMEIKTKQIEFHLDENYALKQLEIIIDIIAEVQKVKLEAEEEDNNRMDPEKPEKPYYQTRTLFLNLESSDKQPRYMLIKLPHSRNQMLALNILLNTMVEEYDALLKDIQESLDQFIASL